MSPDRDHGSERVELVLVAAFVLTLLAAPVLAAFEIISGWVAFAVVVAVSAIVAATMLWRAVKHEGTTLRAVASRIKLEPTSYPRRRVVMVGLVLLLLVGGYAPPITSAAWRRLLGAASGAVLLAMSIAAHRGALDDPDGRVVPTDRSFVLWGEFVGLVLLVAWSANLVG